MVKEFKSLITIITTTIITTININFTTTIVIVIKISFNTKEHIIKILQIFAL